jgi:hypothetical protein
MGGDWTRAGRSAMIRCLIHSAKEYPANRIRLSEANLGLHRNEPLPDSTPRSLRCGREPVARHPPQPRRLIRSE